MNITKDTGIVFVVKTKDGKGLDKIENELKLIGDKFLEFDVKTYATLSEVVFKLSQDKNTSIPDIRELYIIFSNALSSTTQTINKLDNNQINGAVSIGEVSTAEKIAKKLVTHNEQYPGIIMDNDTHDFINTDVINAYTEDEDTEDLSGFIKRIENIKGSYYFK